MAHEPLVIVRRTAQALDLPLQSLEIEFGPSQVMAVFDATDARHTLSDTGAHWLAGLLAHTRGMTTVCTPTINGYGRLQLDGLAPSAVHWGRDNCGAMLRVVGATGDPTTRIENRVGEPAANPYLYMAAQIHAGLDGLIRSLTPPADSETPYAANGERLPRSLSEALAALCRDAELSAGLGLGFVPYFCQIKQHEIDRHTQAEDPNDFERREYFSRL